MYRFPHRGCRGAPPILLGMVVLLPLLGCEGLLGGGSDGRTPVGSAVQVQWRVPVTDLPGYQKPGTDGRYFYAIQERALEARRVSDGVVLWRSRPDYGYHPTNFLAWNGLVLAAGRNAVAVDASTGAQVWTFTPHADAEFGYSAVDDQGFYFGDEAHRVYALEPRTGAVRWITDVGPEWQHRSVTTGVSVSGDTVYAAVRQYASRNGEVAIGWIFALDRATGRILWRYQNGTGTENRYFSGEATVAGRLLVAQDHARNQTIAVDRFTGQEVWRTSATLSFAGLNQAPVVSGDTVFVASHDRNVHALDLRTGRLLWQVNTQGGNSWLAVCGDYLLVNRLGVVVIERSTGRIRGTLVDDHDTRDFAGNGFAVAGNTAFVQGNKAIYGLTCRAG